MPDVDELWRLPKVKKARGVSKSTHYADIKKGLFTEPVALGVRSSGWPASEVGAINAARIAGKPDDEIRRLVERLHAARKAAA